MTINRVTLIGGSAILLPLALILVPWYPWQLSLGLILLAFLPGYALVTALWPVPDNASPNQLEQGLLAAAISYGLAMTLLLLMVFARLPLNLATVSWGLGGLAWLLTLPAWLRRPHAAGPPPLLIRLRQPLLWLVIVLFVAAFFRLTNLHYSDHQGDEADILLRAVSVEYGRIDALLTHSKGPGEILLLDAMGALTGRFDELTARLPFALTGALAVGLIFLLGWRLFGVPVGAVAGLLAAIDGVFVSYARTAQYQSVVLLLTLASIYAFYGFYRSGGQSLRWHAVGTFLLAASCLVHFETVLLLPLVAYLTVAPGLKPDWRKNVAHSLAGLGRLWPSLLIFLGVTAAFYLPFLLHPNLRQTGTYLENRISGGSLPPFNNLGHFFYFEALKYNSAYYVALFDLLALLAAISALVRLVGRTERRRLDLFLGGAVVVVALAGLVLTWFGLAALSALALAAALGLLFAFVILSSYTPLARRLLWLWLAPPFWVYIFLVNRPGKHHYLFLAALLILVADQLVELWQWIVARWPALNRWPGRWLAGGASLALLAVFAAHTVMVLLRSDLEYVLTYPEHRRAFYPTDAAYPYDTRIGFGYPFRLGWQGVGHLKRTGQLDGDWAGNDSGNAPNWYMLGESPTPCYPHYVLRGEITYKGDADFDVPFEPADFGYVARYRIWGNGRLRLTILEFDPSAARPEVVDLDEPFWYDRPVTAADFAGAMGPQSPSAPGVALNPPPVLGEGSELKDHAPAEYLERAQQLDGRVALLGYEVADRYAQTGSILPVTLHWQSQKLLSLRYKVFVHLVAAEGQLVAQADDFPVCRQSHTNTWTPGQIVLDRHLLKLPADLPAGDYTLLAGMYEPELNLRLNYFDIAGNEQGNSLTVGVVTISDQEQE
ncbi:MAG: glycosyltransferase family 39 protein [Chloroflexota bacterium]